MYWSIRCVSSFEGNVHRNIVFRRAFGNLRSEGMCHRDDGNLGSEEKPYDAKGYESKYYEGKFKDAKYPKEEYYDAKFYDVKHLKENLSVVGTDL